MSESVKDKVRVKKNVMKILSSWKKILIMKCEKSKKKTVLINKAILSVKILEWEKSVNKKFKLLILLFFMK